MVQPTVSLRGPSLSPDLDDITHHRYRPSLL